MRALVCTLALIVACKSEPATAPSPAPVKPVETPKPTEPLKPSAVAKSPPKTTKRIEAKGVGVEIPAAWESVEDPAIILGAVSANAAAEPYVFTLFRVKGSAGEFDTDASCAEAMTRAVKGKNFSDLRSGVIDGPMGRKACKGSGTAPDTKATNVFTLIDAGPGSPYMTFCQLAPGATGDLCDQITRSFALESFPPAPAGTRGRGKEFSVAIPNGWGIGRADDENLLTVWKGSSAEAFVVRVRNEILVASQDDCDAIGEGQQKVVKPTTMTIKLVTVSGRKACAITMTHGKRAFVGAFYAAPSGSPYALMCDVAAADSQALKDCDEMRKSFTFEP